ncbi:MAG: hypothetical protein ACOYMZ_02070 [Minisyncoccia bacterium]
MKAIEIIGLIFFLLFIILFIICFYGMFGQPLGELFEDEHTMIGVAGLFGVLCLIISKISFDIAGTGIKIF